MDRHQINRVSALACGLQAFCLMVTLAGCTSWADERQKHYFALYQECMRGEHEPYTIYMDRNRNNSLLSQRCREEYTHYIGTINLSLGGEYQAKNTEKMGTF